MHPKGKNKGIYHTFSCLTSNEAIDVLKCSLSVTVHVFLNVFLVNIRID